MIHGYASPKAIPRPFAGPPGLQQQQVNQVFLGKDNNKLKAVRYVPNRNKEKGKKLLKVDEHIVVRTRYKLYIDDASKIFKIVSNGLAVL